MTPYQIADRIMGEHGTSIEHVFNDVWSSGPMTGVAAGQLSKTLHENGFMSIVSLGRTASWRVELKLAQVSRPIF